MIDTLRHAGSPLAAVADLQIYLLGTPEVLWQGQALQLPRRQARALLYVLAAAGEPIGRERLSFLFWPDEPDAAARRNLTVLLAHLRHALPAHNALAVGDDSVGLNHDLVWCDTRSFATALARAPQQQASDADAAVTLYRGPFLAGFALPHASEFETWVAEERQSWERQYLNLLVAQIEARIGQGLYARAIAAAQRYLEVDSLAEHVHQRLIWLYAMAGQRTAALRQFEQCAIALERELGVSPLPATRAVYDAVRDGAIPPREREIAAGDGQPARSPRKQRPLAPATGEGRAVAERSATLPMATSSLIGREAALAQVCDVIRNGEARLLTICGTGGSGKTRLAIAAAWQVEASFRDGVVFVPLGPLHDPDRVVDTIAQACGVRVIGHESTAVATQRWLRDKQLLLLLDNVEHLLPTAALRIAELLAAAPAVQVVATSRVVLHLSGEHTFVAPPLPLPNAALPLALDALAEQPAVALLLARTRAHTPAFALTEQNAAELAEICVRLDGLPLAIELAAARLKLLSPRALLRRLSHRLALLHTGPRDMPDRQRTLRATIDWSYRLLDLRAQRLFERLSVCTGGWAFATAEGLAHEADAAETLDTLQTLLDSHLITLTSAADGEWRFGMLETIREYALERGHERDDEQHVRQRHAVFFAHFAEQHAPRRYSASARGAIRAIDGDYNNIREALRWSLEANEPLLAARIIGALYEYWDRRGLIEEGRAWTAQIGRLAVVLPAALHAHIRNEAAFQAYRAGDAEAATRLAAEVLHDPDADAVDTARALNLQGLMAQDAGDRQQARAYFQQAFALAHAHALHDDEAAIQCNLGLLALVEGGLDEAEGLNHKSYRYFSDMRVPIMMGTIATTLGFIAVIRAQTHEAAMWLHRGIGLLTEAQETTYLLYGLLACSGLAALRGEAFQAAALLRASSAHAQRVGLQFMPSLLLLVQRSVQQAPAEAARPADTATHLQSLEQLVSSTLAWLDTARQAAERNK